MKIVTNKSLYLKAAAVISVALLIMAFPKEAAGSAVNSINVCLNTIIPSMFAFMVLTSYIQGSGLYKTIFRPVLWMARKLLKADDYVISVFLLSLFGGYPIGVKLLKETIAHNKYSSEIKDLCTYSSCFCYCISPTFAIIMIGDGVFGSTLAGTVIYISNVLSCVIAATFTSRMFILKNNTIENKQIKTGITDAVNSASRALFTVCSTIIAFNTILTCFNALLEMVGIELPVILLGALEISNLTSITEPGIILIPIVSAISSMGGVCVLLQCLSIVNGAFPVKAFLISRTVCGLLSFVISWVMLQFVDVSVSAYTFSSEYIYEFSADKIIVLILIAMCIIIFNKFDKTIRKV